MADFVQKTVNKTAVRDLAVPIATVTSFNTLIESIIADNPFGCVGYTGSDGQPVAAVIRNREHYTVKVNFLDGEGKRVGNVSLLSPTIAAFEANAAAVMGNAALETAMGGEAVRNGPGPCSITAGLPRNSGTCCEDQTVREGAGSDSTCTDRETHLSLSTKVQQNTNTVPGTGSGVGACAGVCEIRNVGIDLMTSSPGGGNTNQTPFNRHLSDITCYNMLKTGAKREPVLQEPLPGILDHRTFSRTDNQKSERDSAVPAVPYCNGPGRIRTGDLRRVRATS